MVLSMQIPEQAKISSLEVQGSEFAVSPSHCPKDLELHHFMVTAAQAALELHIPHEPLLDGENKDQHSTLGMIWIVQPGKEKVSE